jgi:hypothetical protein
MPCHLQIPVKQVAKVFPDLVPETVAAGLKTTRAPSTRFAINIPLAAPAVTATATAAAKQ